MKTRHPVVQLRIEALSVLSAVQLQNFYKMPNDTSDICAVDLRLPAFYTAAPELWFLQVEALLSTKKITSDETKYCHLVSTLPPDVAMEVRDVLIAPPSTDKYQFLKNAIISRIADTERERVQKLLTSEVLGDRRPTQLLCRMMSLLGSQAGSFDRAILKQLFLKRLPPHVQQVLASVSSISIEEQAETADKIMDIPTTNENVSVMAVSHHHQPTPTSVSVPAPPSEMSMIQSTMAAMLKRMDDLTKEMAEMKAANRASRAKSPSRSHGRRNRSSSNSSSLCWYHHNFGDKATKCNTPCSFQGNSNGH